MLGGDLHSPLNQAIFAASRAMDAVLRACREMTVAGREERARLRDRCLPAFAEMRRLARDYFADRATIPPAIDTLERAVAELAGLPVPDVVPMARFQCPACHSRLERRNRYGGWAPFRPTNIFCGRCLHFITLALRTLETWEGGFGTDGI
ncbi:hypothetical protein [Limnoglobus roseus]|uniref:Uncharacterized protein n=1 Tax=Limnoglobus roseus TaxID=2598579 RepID=A0A5C1AKF0_9BACT|nr:hypothetical protein [Limnoglobus roseus]QEL18637.1 hypothetical protein PX52LOC_05670 [Limnoglobus roseus]